MHTFRRPVARTRHLLSTPPLLSAPRRFLSDLPKVQVDANPPVLASTSSITQVPSTLPTLLELSPSTLHSYTLTRPPNQAQLKYAATFFHSSPPQFLFSAAHFRGFPPSSFPEVAFLGRSNVGKSSLLNALFGRTKVKQAHVSKRPGRTRTMNAFGVTGGLQIGAAPKSGEREAAWQRFPRGGLVVVDMPGYGSGSRTEWGTEAFKYLQKRGQLRRTFVLVDAQHGLTPSDMSLLVHLRQAGISHQIVLSKIDKLLCPGSKVPGPQTVHNRLLKIQALCASMRQKIDIAADDGRPTTDDILCCSAERSLDGKHHRKIGIDEVRWAVLSTCGLESDGLGQKKRQSLDNIRILEDEH